MSVMVTDADTDRDAAQWPVEPPADYAAWLKLRPRVARELLQAAQAGALPTGPALRRVCRKLFGAECSASDETRFLIFAAPSLAVPGPAFETVIANPIGVPAMTEGASAVFVTVSSVGTQVMLAEPCASGPLYSVAVAVLS